MVAGVTGDGRPFSLFLSPAEADELGGSGASLLGAGVRRVWLRGAGESVFFWKKAKSDCCFPPLLDEVDGVGVVLGSREAGVDMMAPVCNYQMPIVPVSDEREVNRSWSSVHCRRSEQGMTETGKREESSQLGGRASTREVGLELSVAVSRWSSDSVVQYQYKYHRSSYKSSLIRDTVQVGAELKWLAVVQWLISFLSASTQSDGPASSFRRAAILFKQYDDTTNVDTPSLKKMK
jgi:hypothetical protein